MRNRLTPCIFCLPVFALLTGCNSLQPTAHVVEPDPEPRLSLNAVASADGSSVIAPQAFSLVAADALGLATFGYELALWDAMHEDLAYAE